jgi:hypothetical protein
VSKLRDLAGQVFGRLTVIAREENSRQGQARWKCVCTCGNTSVVFGNNLTREITKSCGCLIGETTRSQRETHGMSNTRPYRIWVSLLARCNNPAVEKYPIYGGRGISYDKSWETFEGFWAEMEDGYSDDLSIDRIDNNAGYSKENCRWADGSTQARNQRKRSITKLPYKGIEQIGGQSFRAKIYIKGKVTRLGTFPTALQAAQAYDDTVEPIIGTRPNGTTKDA